MPSEYTMNYGERGMVVVTGESDLKKAFFDDVCNVDEFAYGCTDIDAIANLAICVKDVLKKEDEEFKQKEMISKIPSILEENIKLKKSNKKLLESVESLLRSLNYPAIEANKKFEEGDGCNMKHGEWSLNFHFGEICMFVRKSIEAVFVARDCKTSDEKRKACVGMEALTKHFYGIYDEY